MSATPAAAAAAAAGPASASPHKPQQLGAAATLVGGTPLVPLRALSAATGVPGALILAKCEFMSGAGASIKDRAAAAMLAAARGETVGETEEANGGNGNGKAVLQAGGLVVEATAGNTGLALAQLCAARGHPLVLTLPEVVAAPKVALLRAAGAEVELCPLVPGTDERHFQRRAQAIAKERGGWWVNQFGNPANGGAHYTSTAPEVWAQVAAQGRRLDGLALATGTGGTLSGCSRYLKERDPRVRVFQLEPPGQGVVFEPPAAAAAAASADADADADADAADPKSREYVVRQRTPEEVAAVSHGLKPGTVIEGIGSGGLYGQLTNARVDEVLRLDDEASISAARFVYQTEGLFVGGTSGANCLGAFMACRKLGPGATVVTVLPDAMNNYLAKYCDDEWLASERKFTKLKAGLKPDQLLSIIEDCAAANGVPATKDDDDHDDHDDEQRP